MRESEHVLKINHPVRLVLYQLPLGSRGHDPFSDPRLPKKKKKTCYKRKKYKSLCTQRGCKTIDHDNDSNNIIIQFL